MSLQEHAEQILHEIGLALLEEYFETKWKSSRKSQALSIIKKPLLEELNIKVRAEK